METTKQLSGLPPTESVWTWTDGDTIIECPDKSINYIPGYEDMSLNVAYDYLKGAIITIYGKKFNATITT